MNSNTFKHRKLDSLWGSSIWTTSERFTKTTGTPSIVGPGSYNALPSPWEKERRMKVEPIYPFEPKPIPKPLKTKENASALCSATDTVPLDFWKHSSKVSMSSRQAFNKAPRITWVDAHAKKAERLMKGPVTQSCPNLLPNFITGERVLKEHSAMGKKLFASLNNHV
jgi:hypothetical protein